MLSASGPAFSFVGSHAHIVTGLWTCVHASGQDEFNLLRLQYL